MCEHCKEIIEIWAGMEGFISKTAPEEYLQWVLKQIYKEACKGAYDESNT